MRHGGQLTELDFARGDRRELDVAAPLAMCVVESTPPMLVAHLGDGALEWVPLPRVVAAEAMKTALRPRRRPRPRGPPASSGTASEQTAPRRRRLPATGAPDCTKGASPRRSRAPRHGGAEESRHQRRQRCRRRTTRTTPRSTPPTRPRRAAGAACPFRRRRGRRQDEDDVAEELDADEQLAEEGDGRTPRPAPGVERLGDWAEAQLVQPRSPRPLPGSPARLLGDAAERLGLDARALRALALVYARAAARP